MADATIQKWSEFTPQLIDLIKKEAIEYGDFTLKSGLKSSYYLDCRKITISQHINFITEFFNVFLKTNLVDFDAVGGPALGACPIVTTLASTCEKRAGFVRNDVKNHGKKDLIIGSIRPSDRVIVVEDVTTSGSSLFECCKKLQDFGCTVVYAMTLIDRLQGANELFQLYNIPFHPILTIRNLFDC